MPRRPGGAQWLLRCGPDGHATSAPICSQRGGRRVCGKLTCRVLAFSRFRVVRGDTRAPRPPLFAAGQGPLRVSCPSPADTSPRTAAGRCITAHEMSGFATPMRILPGHVVSGISYLVSDTPAHRNLEAAAACGRTAHIVRNGNPYRCIGRVCRSFKAHCSLACYPVQDILQPSLLPLNDTALRTYIY